MIVLSFVKFLSLYGDSGSARNSNMPRETFRAPATLPLLSTSGASRTSTTSALPFAIISRACAGVIRGTAAFAASIICLMLMGMTVAPWLKKLLPVLHPSADVTGRSICHLQTHAVQQKSVLARLPHWRPRSAGSSQSRTEGREPVAERQHLLSICRAPLAYLIVARLERGAIEILIPGHDAMAIL